MLATQEGHADIVELLIENHADLDMQNKVHPAIYTIITYKINMKFFIIMYWYHTTNISEGMEQSKKFYMTNVPY